jgi:1-acyl-sn-glycerol-3-phosphate acyltransferase
MPRETPPVPATPRTPLTRAVIVGAASGLGWLVFVLLLIAALPVLLALSWLDRRVLRAFGSWGLRLFFVHFLSAIRFHRVVERPSPERVRALGQCVFVANHRSWFDGLLALALFPGVRMPVNASYLRLPVLGRAIRWSGCIPFDRGAPAGMLEGVNAARDSLAGGHSLFVFPEGTRGSGRGVSGFSDASFRLAGDRGIPIAPVVLHSDTLTLSPGAPGFLPWRCARWRIRLLEPLAADPRDRPADLARRAWARIAEALHALDGEGAMEETGSVS